MRPLSATLVTSTALAFSFAACSSEDSKDSSDESAACSTKLIATYPDGTDVELDQAQAVSLAEGGAFTVYAGDYEIPTTDIGTATVTPPSGSHQANIYLTVIGSLSDVEPIEAGVTVPYTTEADVLTFSTILLSDEGMNNQAVEGSGEITVSDVDKDAICLEIDYSDDEKALSGTVAAQVTQSPF